MLSDLEREEKKQQILHDCFELFVIQGLENTSMNDLTKYCDTYKAAFYHYFKSKDEIVIESAKIYMEELDIKVRKLLNEELSLEDLIEAGLLMIFGEKKNLRYIYQVLSSPKYGEESRKTLSDVYSRYLGYSSVIASKYKIDHDLFRPLFLAMFSVIHDYCLWENENLVKEKLDSLRKDFNEMVSPTMK